MANKDKRFKAGQKYLFRSCGSCEFVTMEWQIFVFKDSLGNTHRMLEEDLATHQIGYIPPPE